LFESPNQKINEKRLLVVIRDGRKVKVENLDRQRTKSNYFAK